MVLHLGTDEMAPNTDRKQNRMPPINQWRRWVFTLGISVGLFCSKLKQRGARQSCSSVIRLWEDFPWFQCAIWGKQRLPPSAPINSSLITASQPWERGGGWQTFPSPPNLCSDCRLRISSWNQMLLGNLCVCSARPRVFERCDATQLSLV